jgi:hypothetical protein
MIHGNKKGTCMLTDVAIPGDINVLKTEAENVLKQRPSNANTVFVECENKSDTSNNRGDWNHFKITKTTPKEHTRRARN